MSLMAEQVVEEWLNRQGFFTIRNIHLGVNEMDLVAVRPSSGGGMECRHIEVQVSTNPIGYISVLPRAVQRATHRAPNTMKRSHEELVKGVEEWVEKKFDAPKKRALLTALCPGDWTRELVVHNLRKVPGDMCPELSLIEGHGIRVHRFRDILTDLSNTGTMITAASGSDLVTLMSLLRPADDAASTA